MTQTSPGRRQELRNKGDLGEGAIRAKKTGCWIRWKEYTDGAKGVDRGVLSRDAGVNVLTGAAGIGSNSLHLHFLKHRNKSGLY